MKKLTPFFCGVAFLFMGLVTVTSQDSTTGKVRVQKRTLMNKFEPDYVLSVAERIALKQSRLAHQYRVKSILDTLNISVTKKRRLLKELKRNPFSEIILQTLDKEANSVMEKSN